MASTAKAYNKREYVTDNKGRLLKRENVCFGLIQHPENKNVLLASDRAYVVQPDGSLRRIKEPSKKERREMGVIHRKKS